MLAERNKISTQAHSVLPKSPKISPDVLNESPKLSRTHIQSVLMDNPKIYITVLLHKLCKSANSQPIYNIVFYSNHFLCYGWQNLTQMKSNSSFHTLLLSQFIWKIKCKKQKMQRPIILIDPIYPEDLLDRDP